MISGDKDTNKREQIKEKKRFSLVLSSGSIFGEAKGNKKSQTLVLFPIFFVVFGRKKYRVSSKFSRKRLPFALPLQQKLKIKRV